MHRAGERERERDRLPQTPHQRDRDGDPTRSDPDSRGRGIERDESSDRSAPRLPERSGLNRRTEDSAWEDVGIREALRKQ